MRALIGELERCFEEIHLRSIEMFDSLPEQTLFSVGSASTGDMRQPTIAEMILRSAAMVEMAFGGLTTRLWDDPFEWTLPEELNSKARALAYLDEVRSTRVFGMGFLRDDSELTQLLPAPAELRTVGSVLIRAIVDAELLLYRARRDIRSELAKSR